MRTSLILLSVALAGCGALRTGSSSSADCAGDNYAIVTNEAGVAVDIHAQVAGTSTPVVLGIVSSGERRELLLPETARRVYASVSLPGVTFRPDRVRIRYECRE
jgi:hypothetical protein